MVQKARFDLCEAKQYGHVFSLECLGTGRSVVWMDPERSAKREAWLNMSSLKPVASEDKIYASVCSINLCPTLALMSGRGADVCIYTQVHAVP